MSATLDPASDTANASPSGESGWTDALHRLDDWCERFGDAVNPILVKETRQALKSRQFVVTFSLLLLAALGWTVMGSLSMMPQIYTSPSAPNMMIGFYVVLAIPMLLVVPLAAYRSLEGEIDDGTLELLTITTLSPWQIVLGKLAGASLQMLLYFVTLFPCLAFAYSLRGVDLPTTFLIVGALGVVGLFLTILGLFFAPISRGRTNRVISLLASGHSVAARRVLAGSDGDHDAPQREPIVNQRIDLRDRCHGRDGNLLWAPVALRDRGPVDAGDGKPIDTPSSLLARLYDGDGDAHHAGVAHAGTQRGCGGFCGSVFSGGRIVVVFRFVDGGRTKHDHATDSPSASQQFLRPDVLDMAHAGANDGSCFYDRGDRLADRIAPVRPELDAQFGLRDGADRRKSAGHVRAARRTLPGVFDLHVDRRSLFDVRCATPQQPSR